MVKHRSTYINRDWEKKQAQRKQYKGTYLVILTNLHKDKVKKCAFYRVAIFFHVFIAEKIKMFKTISMLNLWWQLRYWEIVCCSQPQGLNLPNLRQKLDFLKLVDLQEYPLLLWGYLWVCWTEIIEKEINYLDLRKYVLPL